MLTIRIDFDILIFLPNQKRPDPALPWPSCKLKAPSPEALNTFEAYLRQSLLDGMLEQEKGRNILAACGQLA